MQMDGKQKQPRFPKFEYMPPPEEEPSTVSVASTGSESKVSKKEEKVWTPPPAEEGSALPEEPVPWPQGPGFLPGRIMVSVNGGTTFRELPFEFTAYRSNPATLACGSAVGEARCTPRGSKAAR